MRPQALSLIVARDCQICSGVSPAANARLLEDNRRLTDRLETAEDRLAVLERIVTDSGYRLGHEIERLRDEKGNVQ